MAKQIEELLIRLKTDGYEEVTKLKSAFRGLEAALGQSDRGLSEVREGLLDLANNSQRSEALLKGLESAFKSLRAQAELQSPLYKQLGNDIDGLGRELAQLSTRYETVAERATQAATAQQNAANAAARNQYLNRPTEQYQPPGARVAVEPTAYDEAVAAITEVNTRASRTIASLEEQKSAWERLRRVVDPTSDAFKVSTQNVKLLQAELDKLAISQKKVTQTADENPLSAFDKAKKTLDEVVGRSDNTIGSLQEQAAAWAALRNALDPASASFVTATRRLVELRKRLDALKVPEQVKQPDVKTVNTAYEKALADLREVKRVSNDSIQSLNAQKNAWTALRNAVSPSSEAFANATKQVEQLTKQLDALAIKQEKVNKTAPGRRFSARQAAEVAGAAISGGIFGGPEGFLGGVAGGALGGVGGAFAGAALGAQVAGLRQAAGAAAEYAAAINQQRRALEGVVDSNAAYQQSLAFIDQTSRQLAIPQEQVTRNFTRLSASVLGAGGNVDAAQEAFLGIAAGIRGTGGSLADLDAALLATAQVFSKGKVSAEELRGQIGERLPGAFTLFAESIGKTPQELDKLLEKGEVTLNDFLTFTRRLNAEYGAGANELANSSEAAGDRLVTAFGRIQEAIGTAFQPVGAEFQEALSRFVLENEQALVSLAQSLADVGKGFLDFVVTAGPALVELGKFALAFGAATLATKAFTAAMPALRTALVLLQAQFGQMTAQAAAAQTRLVAFGATVKSLAASLAAPIVLTIAIVGVTKVLEDLNRVRRARQELAELPDPVADVGRAYGNRVTAADRQRLEADLEETGNQVLAQRKKVEELRVEYEKANKAAAVSGFAARAFNVIGRASRQAAEDEYRTAVARLGSLEERFRLLGGKMSQIGTGSPAEAFQFPTAAADADGAKTKKGPKPPEDRTQELRAEAELFGVIAGYENQIRDLLFEGKEIKAADLEYNKQVAQIEAEREKAIRAANYESEKQAIRTLATLKLRDAELKLEDSIREIRNKNFQQELQNQEAVRNAIEPLKQAREQQELQLQNAKEYGRLVAEGVLPDEAQRIINWQNLVAQQLKSLDTQIKITEEQITQAELKNQELGKEDIATKQLRDKLALLRRQREAVQTQAQAGPGRGPTQAERVQFEIDKLQGELNQLASISNVIVNSANAIGDAFANAFQKLISGTASAKEVLAGFFQDTANAFIKMATEIIAKQIVMLILQTALKALGAAGTGSGGGSLNLSDVGAYADTPVPFTTADFSGSAKGNAFTPQGPVQMYAKGGVVNGITPFRFAKGGTMGLGVMGEAGPEAVLPLKRNASGELGVLQVPYTKAGVAQGGSENDMIRFESVVINNQEYVTREEAERIGQVAASRGADIAQRRIKNNPQVRRSLGMA